MKKEGTRKLNVVRVEAHIYHYGWVRPPMLMSKKQKYFGDCYTDENRPTEELKVISEVDFGPLGSVPEFTHSHPVVMTTLLKSFDWGEQLNYSNKKVKGSKPQSHERLKYRFLTFIERLFFKDGVFTFENYKLLRR